MRAGFCGGFVAQWLWRPQPDTLGSSPAVDCFSLFSFLPEQVEFQLNFCRQSYYSETSLIRHLYNPTFSLIRPLYEVQSPNIRKYGKRHSIIQQPPNPTLFSGPIECRIREVSLYYQSYTTLDFSDADITICLFCCF